MDENISPLEELQGMLASFVEQTEQSVMFLTTMDEEVPTIVRVIDGLDGDSPEDVYFFHTAPVTDAASWVDGLLAAVLEQWKEANEERVAGGLQELAAPPPACSRRDADPFERLRTLIAHMTTWLPEGDDHRLVVALVPEHIADREAHARIAGTLVPFHGRGGWPKRLRLVLRDDRRAPFVVDTLRAAGVRGPCLYTTRVTVADIADATAQEAANPKLAPARRINALLQCASLDVALGRYEAAIEKFGTLYSYYDLHEIPEMKAFVLQGLGDVMSRLNRLPAARERYLQALDIAAEAKSLQLILQVATAIGDIDMRLEAFTEADVSFTLGVTTAHKLGNVFARADLLEKCGDARMANGNVRGASDAWGQSAHVAREFAYDPRLHTVLKRLRDLSSRAGYRDLAAGYESELREVDARLAMSGGAA